VVPLVEWARLVGTADVELSVTQHAQERFVALTSAGNRAAMALSIEYVARLPSSHHAHHVQPGATCSRRVPRRPNRSEFAWKVRQRGSSCEFDRVGHQPRNLPSTAVPKNDSYRPSPLEPPGPMVGPNANGRFHGAATLALMQVQTNLANGRIPHHQLSASFDIQAGDVHYAPQRYTQRAQNLENACRFIASIWESA
jgi:hypothetical protein